MEYLAAIAWQFTIDSLTGIEKVPALHYFAHYVFYTSMISLLLPPIEMFDNFPRFQKYYTVVVNLMQYYGAQNWRGKIAQLYIARRNGGKPA